MSRSKLTPDDPRHGTENGYKNLKCRCDACKAAWSVYMRDYRTRCHNTLLAVDDPRHGNYATYQTWGCRCSKCRSAYSVYRKTLPSYRKRLDTRTTSD